ncbi:MAG: ABC transporter ATP-binding protein [Syntrophales bacterium]|jgi:branched-chain amino acid transport system ATP-binding protein|nr:ABC transporter ATP-binding protein [Syntrophales bacterium]MCK9527264.1 ABC transporter ATP-binding protein [Syntrophales bacterium]MDX9921266.1 ABC transporter ATP-binding protein [Syntrophales bacterium]
MKSLRGQPRIFEGKAGTVAAELAVENLSLSFGGVMALNDVSLELSTGELLAVIGPNGAGKTSLLNCLTGYYHPQKGTIRFNGEDVTGYSSHHLVEKGIGRTFQNIELFTGMSVISNMLMARHLHGSYSFAGACLFLPSVRREEIRNHEIVEEIIDFLEMQPIRKQLVGSLPYGLRKRVELGRALALEPRLLVLDEPFAGMNLEEKEDMVRFLAELSRSWKQTMILVEHDMSVVMSLSDRVVALNFGRKLAEGSPEEIQENTEVIRAYLGDKIDLE